MAPLVEPGLCLLWQVVQSVAPMGKGCPTTWPDASIWQPLQAVTEAAGSWGAWTWQEVQVTPELLCSDAL